MLRVFLGCLFAIAVNSPPDALEQSADFGRKLRTISYKLSRSYYDATKNFHRHCTKDGQRWDDNLLPEPADRSSRQFFYKNKLMCDGAILTLTTLRKIASNSNPHALELYAFTAFTKDLRDLDRSDLYIAHVIGPFDERAECEAWHGAFQDHEIGTMRCESYALDRRRWP